MMFDGTPPRTDKPVSDIRKEIGVLDFEFWVRRWKDGQTWVGAVHGSEARKDALVLRLSDLGYLPVCNGTPGTSGAYVVEI